MKTSRFPLKRYWREAIILIVLVVIAFALPYFEVRNPMLTMLVAIIVAVYFFTTWACKPRHGDNSEKE